MKKNILEISSLFNNNLEKNYTKYETNIYNGKILRLEKFLKNNIPYEYLTSKVNLILIISQSNHFLSSNH